MLTLTCCDRHTVAWDKMNTAESMMEEHPDSALTILNNLDTISFGGKEESARFALLKSMALDKNYIDTTDFKVLQPAIDYYLKKGTPDEKLRTYYYQGRIYQNRGEEDKAMDAYYSGCDNIPLANDTLSIVRILTAQGTLFYKQYKFKEFIDNSLKCANLLQAFDSDNSVLFDYAKALNGAVLLNNKELADSILNLSLHYIDGVPYGYEYIKPQILLYTIQLGSNEERKQILNKYKDNVNTNEENLNLAYGYCLVKDRENALISFQKVDTLDSSIRPTTYLSIKSDVLALNGHYKEAYETHQIYTDSLESLHQELFSKDLLFADKRHEIEINNLRQIQEKDRAIGLWAGGVLALLLICGLVYYRYRLGKAKHELSEKEVLRLSLERSALSKEKERLELENRNKELELSRQILEAENLQKEKHAIELERNNSELNLKKTELEAENLRLQIAQLEDERDEIKGLLQKSELSDSVKEVIRERLNMLNSLMAKEITNNKNHSRQYDDWVASMRSDSEKFMNSTRLALQASYPKMIEYLVSHGLTEHEMNYVCLYAIGLRGKEVGEFTKIKGHYNLSSEIRKKLGLEESDTNLGNFVRGLMNH